MSERTEAQATTTDREITISRLIDAPRDLVFRAIAEPEHLIHWWGPDGFTNTFHEIDFRPGGIWRFVMHGPDGTDYENLVEFREIVPPERITYRHSDPGDDSFGFDASITLEEVDGRTRVTLHSVFDTADMREMVVREFGAIEGGHQTLGRLDAYVQAMS